MQDDIQGFAKEEVFHMSGSTALCVFMEKRNLFVFNLGNARAILFREGIVELKKKEENSDELINK
jgi:serine/threonine protein phosphatase PrpC